MQLWSFNGEFIINKKSGLFVDVTEGKQPNRTELRNQNFNILLFFVYQIEKSFKI